MNRTALIALLESFPGSSPDMPFGPDALVFKVAGKMFALLSERSDVSRVNLKCEPALAEVLRATYPAVTPGYHMNKKHWNTILLDDTVPSAEVKQMVERSYALVVASLTQKKRAALEAH